MGRFRRLAAPAATISGSHLPVTSITGESSRGTETRLDRSSAPAKENVFADLAALAQSIIDGMADSAERITAAALSEQLAHVSDLDDGVLAGMRQVDERFRKGAKL